MYPDNDGDCLLSRGTWELMTSCPEVRVLIPPNTKRNDAIRLLKKITKWLEREKDKIEVGEFSEEMKFELQD